MEENNIIIKNNDEYKRCEIWVDYSEKLSYKLNNEYIKTINQYKNLKYSINVFVGGDRPLLPTITSLLEAQI